MYTYAVRASIKMYVLTPLHIHSNTYTKNILYPAIIGILIVYSPDDDPLESKHVGQFLYNKNDLYICQCIT